MLERGLVSRYLTGTADCSALGSGTYRRVLHFLHSLATANNAIIDFDPEDIQQHDNAKSDNETAEGAFAREHYVDVGCVTSFPLEGLH